MTILGIDLGERRIGIAVADGDGDAARPLTTLRRGRDPEADAAAVERLAREQRADELVVGLPLEANGDDGPQAQLTRAWALLIGERVGLPVALRDERYSSHLAEQRLGPMKRGRSGGPPTAAQREVYRSRVDREAAAIILQDELDARAAAGVGNARYPAPPQSHPIPEEGES